MHAQGTVQLKGMPKVSQTCKALGVDYAVAMTGFEVRGGQSVPVFDGVVIAEEHAAAVEEAYWAAERSAHPPSPKGLHPWPQCMDSPISALPSIESS